MRSVTQADLSRSPRFVAQEDPAAAELVRREQTSPGVFEDGGDG